MSGATPPEGQTPRVLPALEAATTAVISTLFDAKLQAAFAAHTNAAPQPGPASEGAPPQQPQLPVSPSGGSAPPPPLSRTAAQPSGTAAALAAAASGTGAENPNQRGEGSYSEVEDPEEDTCGPQAFAPKRYKARRWAEIPVRFEIPPRFDPSYSIRFEPESIAHYRTFSIPGSSTGRAEEGSGLYATAAYLTEASNALFVTVNDLVSVLNPLPYETDSKGKRDLRSAITAFSDAQLCSFGIYELTASRYEVLAGKQGAFGAADPELLSAYINPPATYSSAGRQGFRRQKAQEIRYAALTAGRNRGRLSEPLRDLTQPKPSKGDRGRGRGRTGGRGRGRGKR